MLNFTPATAGAANAYAAQAATRPLAGFGAGAFTCEGASVGSGVSEMTAALALPRIKPAIGAIGTGQSQAADRQRCAHDHPCRNCPGGHQEAQPDDPHLPGYPGWIGSVSGEGTGTGLAQTGQIPSRPRTR